MDKRDDIEFLEKLRRAIDQYLFLGYAPTQVPISFRYDAEADGQMRAAMQDPKFRALRRSIDEMKPRARKLFAELNLTPKVTQFPPQAVGGPVLNWHLLDLVTDNQSEFPLEKDTVLGAIDQAIGALKTVPPQQSKPLASYDFSKIHQRIRKECESLFVTGHYAEAIRKAFTVVDVMVKEKSGLDKSGKALMGEAFKASDPIIKLNELREQSDRDEQEGFMLLYMGAMQGIRNPKSHDLVDQRDPIRTLEYLAIASLLARRVDEGKKRA